MMIYSAPRKIQLRATTSPWVSWAGQVLPVALFRLTAILRGANQTPLLIVNKNPVSVVVSNFFPDGLASAFTEKELEQLV